MWFSILLTIIFVVFINGQFELNPTKSGDKKCTMENGEQGLCIIYYLCHNETNKVNTDGSYVIDIRAMTECDFTEMCCGLPDNENIATANKSPNSTNQDTRINGEKNNESKGNNILPIPSTLENFPLTNTCGVRNDKGVAIRITGDYHNEAQFGEFPWTVAILLKQKYDGDKDLYIYQCGGSLIHPKVVLTAAHCLNREEQEMKVRLGEYDTQITSEPLGHQDIDVIKTITHESFYSGGLFNDVGLVILKNEAMLKPHIGVVCLPPFSKTVEPSTCFATGWGKNEFGKKGLYQNIMKKIDLPLVPNGVCQDTLRTTRLGKHFMLHDSFVCAGGVSGKDVCTGDGGGPLVCEISGQPGKYMQVGIVSWGIGCGTTVPGVYTNVPYLREWIDEQLILNNIDINPYLNNNINND